ncbi:RNA polymerase, sigma 54 subunit, RpoN/SigL [Alteribacillus persepolensis]|uniref:RNA polymerase, sigma 54 subunit, RpoN/SigL n=1 Tax=Alteribacillus persepolensis TaxID=568899 RepID=A0A1G8AJS4_9BACI|nr:RNA polymerase factor sigma-54 [Alteribacillus persepolensis]SDH21272.1 RNA polymerase, sigma 54 subunit, RpoN/SigL [Alteribacillus persepolensis]
MNMEMGLFQQQAMKLVMTQELRQAISLLQYSTLELSEYLEEQALENPMMEIEEPSHAMKEDISYQMPVMWNDEPSEVQEQEEEQASSPFDRIKDDRQRLADYLVQQIRFLSCSEQEKQMLMHMAGNVGDSGYLEGTYEDMKRVFSISETEYEDCVAMLQALEPAGIGARSLKECLLLQLERQVPRNHFAEWVVENHIEELAARKWKKVAKQADVTLQDIQQVYDDIQKLDPYPGSSFAVAEPPAHVYPDVYVEQDKEGLVVRLNNDSLPRIRMNRQYRHLLENPAEDEATEYAKKKYKQLVWLLKSIDQRQQTIRNITEAIVKFQREFFEFGPSALKPLTLKDVANEADVHESTVSRTTTQKYVQTPQGLFELKYFFTAGLNSGSGEQTSTSVIKSMLEKLVEEEDKRKPLSDQKIADYIKGDHDIAVSRRAVAKYRNELNIPSSSKRKRY